MDKNTKQAVLNSATHICAVLNPILLPLYGETLTPEELIFRVVTSEHSFPDGKQVPMRSTVRGVEQRLYHLAKALAGDPGAMWMRYWGSEDGGFKEEA